MNNKINRKLSGTVKVYNGQFGFLTSETGDIYFHKSGIADNNSLRQGDTVEFETEPSKKKAGNYQAINLSVIRKGTESDSKVKSLIGILKWFDHDKGFGIIGTPERKEYFLHKSEVSNISQVIQPGTVLIFSEKDYKNRKSATACRLAGTFEDFELALEYLAKADTVSIEYRTEQRGRRGGVFYSSDIKHLSLKNNSVIQILNSKTTEARINYISIYFENRIKILPVESHLIYFAFVKAIFIKTLRTESTEVLSCFFSRFSTYLEPHAELKYSLWLEGYIKAIDYEYVIQKLSDEYTGTYNNLIRRTFEQFVTATDQEQILNDVLSTIGSIDSQEKYNRIRTLAGEKRILDTVIVKFLASATILCDEERRYQLWLDGFIEHKNLQYISVKLAESDPHFYNRLHKPVFAKLKEESEQTAVITQLVQILGSIDCSEKYSKIKSLAGLSEVNERSKKELISLAYRNCDDERKYLLWKEGYTHVRDLNYIAGKLDAGNNSSTTDLLQSVVNRLNNHSEKADLLNVLLERTGNIDTPEKYSLIKSIAGLNNISDETRSDFLSLSLINSDEERKYLFWLDGFTQEKNLKKISEKVLALIKSSYISYNLHIIFERLNNKSDHEKVLSDVLTDVGNIDSTVKYNRIRDLTDLHTISKPIKTKFIRSAFALCDEEHKYLFWLNGFTIEKNLHYIAHKVAEAKVSPYSTNLYQQIFAKLPDNSEQATVLDKVINEFGGIDSIEKYDKIKALYKLKEIKEPIRTGFLHNSIKCCPVQFRYELFNHIISGSTAKSSHGKHLNESFLSIYQKDYEYYIWMYKNGYFRVSEDEIKNDISLIENIFSLGYNDFNGVAEYINQFRRIDDDVKYNAILPFIKSLREFLSVTKQLKISAGYSQFNDLLCKVTNTDYKIKFWLEDLIEADLTFQKELIERLLNNGNPEAILKKNNIAINQSLYFAFLESIEPDDRAAAQENFFNTLGIYRSNLSNTYYFFESLLLTKIVRLPNRLKLWVHNYINAFDFNAYCYYYFILNPEEKKLFSKKAKAIMGEEVKKSLLKSIEPWKYIKTVIEEPDKEINIYSANWKSVWFEKGYIRICIDEGQELSKPFNWGFSEEEFNLLYNYISGRRLRELEIKVLNGDIIHIDGLEELEQVIIKAWIQKEKESGSSRILRETGLNRIPVNILLRNQCLQFLIKLQRNGLEPTWIEEQTIDITKKKKSFDYSCLFSILLNNDEVAIIWESLEIDKSKATHIFKSTMNEYQNVFSEIELYLSANHKVRSTLNSNDYEAVENQKRLRYLCRIEHDNFNFSKWQNSLLNIFPELAINILSTEASSV